jgi:hypothetical protein
VLVCGAIWFDLFGVRTGAITLELPIAAKVAVGIFLTYATGLFLHYATNALSQFTAYACGYALSKKWNPINAEPWKNSDWRKVARRVLGSFAPATDDIYFAENEKSMMASLNALVDLEFRQQQVSVWSKHFFKLRMADLEWYWWHRVLNERFPKIVSATAEYHSYIYFLATLFSMGWALIIICGFAQGSHWFLWTAAILAIFAGWLGDFSKGFQVLLAGGDDPYGIELSARMLWYLEQCEGKAIDGTLPEPAKDSAKVDVSS